MKSHREDGLVRVKLTQIHLVVRVNAAAQCAKTEVDPGMRAELLAAALFPSENVYYLPGSVRPRLAEVAAA